jgi:hypothetical protein
MADIVGTESGDTLNGTAGDDIVSAFGGNDLIYLHQGGTDQVDAGDGNDGLYFGNTLTAADRVIGGAGLDTLALRGTYGSWVTGFRFGPNSLTGIEELLLASASNTSFGDPTPLAEATYYFDLLDRDVSAGTILTVIAGSPGAGVPGLQPGEFFTFNAPFETDGAFRIFAGLSREFLRGGAGNDGFFFATGALGPNDVVLGNGGTDTIALRGDYDGPDDDGGGYQADFASAGLQDFEVLALLSGHSTEFGGEIVPEGYDYDIISSIIPDPAGKLDVQAQGLTADETVRFDGRANTGTGVHRVFSGAGDDIIWTGQGNDYLYGALGADRIDGGIGDDLYVYRAIAESTPLSRDTLTLSTGDRIDLSFIDAIAGTPGNDAFTFIGGDAFSGSAGQVRVVAEGDGYRVEADVNGDAAADLAISVTSPEPLVAADFVL